jgi:hypothetical protein
MGRPVGEVLYTTLVGADQVPQAQGSLLVGPAQPRFFLFFSPFLLFHSFLFYKSKMLMSKDFGKNNIFYNMNFPKSEYF